MGYAADFERTIEPLDARLEKVATPLRKGLETLNKNVEELTKALQALEGDHKGLNKRVQDESKNLLAVVRALGFSPKANPAVENTEDDNKK